MKTYIVGTGGVGGYFGGVLANAGNDVTFLARGLNYKTIKEKGLMVKSVIGDFVIKPARVRVAKDLSKAVNQDTVIITLQNGVDNDDQIKKFITNANVYPGVAYLISAKTKPGVIEQTGGLRKLIFGDRYKESDAKLLEIEVLLKKAGINAVVSEDISKDLWEKFMFIVAFSGMTTICRRTIGEVLSDPVTKSVYERCLREAISVARAMKVNVADDAFETAMAVSYKTLPSSKSSLLVDIENDRKNEIETLNGTLVKFAKEKSIDVPINELMEFLKKYKKEILIGLGLVVLYFVSRLVNLTALPIFTDEAIYLRWAQIAKNDAAWRFISLTDGKQPLFVWLAMVMMKIVENPLVAGRVVSVISGIFGMLFAGLLAWELFKSKKIAFLSSILYLIYPSALLYDRMALMDGLLAVTILIALYLSVLLVKTLRLDIALLLGMAMGATMLVKTSGFFTLYLLPLSLLLFDFSSNRQDSPIMSSSGLTRGSKNYIDSRIRGNDNDKVERSLSTTQHKAWQIIKLLSLMIVSAILSQIYYAVLRLSPLYHMIAEKDATFVYPIREWINHPFLFFLGNLRGMTDWLIHYFSWPLVLLGILALIFSIRNFLWERLYLLLWFLLPFVALALFGKVLYPRFILFMTMPLLVLIASGFLEISALIKNNKLQTLIIILFLLPSLFFDYQILFDIKNASLTQIDKGQYVNDWPAGWGVNESVEILKKEASKGKIAIFTDGTFGLMPYSIELYLVYSPNVYIKGLWPLDEKFPEEMLKSAKVRPTFFIANQKQNIPLNWPLKLLGEWQKGNNKKSSLRLYQVAL